MISTVFHLHDHGVATVGKVAAGLPSVHAVRLSVSNLWVLLPSAAGMMLVIFSEALGAAQTFADKHGYRLDPSQDMIALGLANIASGPLGRRQPVADRRQRRCRGADRALPGHRHDPQPDHRPGADPAVH